jgi:ATP-dependent Clp protease ATP-binding subunit ClpA
MSAAVSDPQVLGTLLLSSTALVSLLVARVGKSRLNSYSAGSGVRFSDDIHASLVVAMREALSLGHQAVDVEHLLLGVLASNSGAANTILTRLGVNPELLHAKMFALLKPGNGSASSDLPYSRRAFAVLDETALEALALGHTRAGTEHLLLGILKQRNGAAARVLVEAGAPLAVMRREAARYPG